MSPAAVGAVWPLSRITIGKRARKRLGDIDALAKSIATVGLLHPIVVQPDGQLVAGFRRIKALERLGRDEAPVTIARDVDDEIAALTAERDENTCREDFTTAEVHDIAKRLLAQEKEAAKARQREGSGTRSAPGSKAGSAQVAEPARDPRIERMHDLPQSKPKPREPESMERVAKAVGVGKETLRRIEAVYEAAEENPKLAPVRESLEREERAAPAHEIATQWTEKQRAATAGSAGALHFSSWRRCVAPAAARMEETQDTPEPLERDHHLLGWVVVDGELRDVSEFASLPTQQRPVALCPQCDRRVTLKLGKVLAHHAAHQPGDECAATAPETALHLNAKFHLAAALRDVATMRLREPCHGTSCDRSRERPWSVAGWDDVRVEQPVGTLRPDVTLLRAGVAIAAVEVFATHAVDSVKEEALGSLGLPWVEVRAEDVLGQQPWTNTMPLLVHRQGPERPWRCGTCTLKFEVEEREATARREAVEHAQANGEFSICARVVDFFFRSGKRLRKVYEVLEERAGGKVVAVIVRRNDGEQVRVEATDAAKQQKAQQVFSGLMRDFEARGAIVDTPMPWLRDGASWLGSGLVAFGNLHYPRRFEFDEAARVWRQVIQEPWET